MFIEEIRQQKSDHISDNEQPTEYKEVGIGEGRDERDVGFRKRKPSDISEISVNTGTSQKRVTRNEFEETRQWFSARQVTWQAICQAAKLFPTSLLRPYMH
jgi:hypothetical protein